MTRLERLATLHELRVKVDAEIVALERQMSLEREHARQLARAAKRRRAVALCGTASGYYRHRRKYREPACEDCKRAHRQAELDRVRRRKLDKTEVA